MFDRSQYIDQTVQKVRDQFGEALEPKVILRTIVLPSFSESYAVCVRKTESGHDVLLLVEPRIPLSAHTLAYIRSGAEQRDEYSFAFPEQVAPGRTQARTSVEMKPDDEWEEEIEPIPVVRYVQPLPRKTARKLHDIWKEMLLKARPPRDARLGADGTMYHYHARFRSRGAMNGQIWSPEEGSKTWDSNRLTETLADYARGKSDLEDLKKAIDDFERGLSSAPLHFGRPGVGMPPGEN
jgi:hypothetical protein